MLAADQFVDGIDFLRREGDDRGAPRLPRDLAVAGEFEQRQPRPRDDGGARQQPLDDRAHGGGAEQHGLVAAAAMQETSRSRGIASTVETQKRGFFGLIFSSPVISATLSGPARSAILL